MTGGGSVTDSIARWRPRVFSPEAAMFARQVVTAAAPTSMVRARPLLAACAELADFGIGVGLDVEASVLLHPSVIERFVIVGIATASPVRRRCVRTNLRFVARRVVPQLWPPDPVPLARDRAKTPYSDAEIAAYLALADAQPSVGRRHRLAALVCAGAGAGLCGADLRHVRGRHVGRRAGGLVIEVTGGPAPRVVPVLARFQRRLVDAAAFAGDGFLLGGRDADRHNITNRLVAHVAGGADLARLDVSRLRASWLATQAQALGLSALFAAAGIACSQHLGDVVARLPAPDVSELVARLGASG